MGAYGTLTPQPLSNVMQKPPTPGKVDPKVSPNFNWIWAEDPHKPLAAVIRKLILNQNARLNRNTRHASLYLNENLMLSYRPAAGRDKATMPAQTLNLIKVYTDTLAGKLIQSNARVQAMSIQGDWKTYRLVKKLDRILDTTFLQARLFRECSKVAIDALKVGIGFLYVGEEDGKIVYERWFYNELFVDQLDAMYGRPTMLFRVRYMYPDAAQGLWGKDARAAEAINKAPLAQPPAFAWTPWEYGMIEIFEAWALEMPNRKGRHVLCTAAGVILDQPYTREDFPVVAFRASERDLGWYGQGFISHSGATQVWLNRILDIMARSAHLGMSPYWITAGGADISIKQLNNEVGHIVTSNGPPPQWVTNQPFHPEATNYAQLLMKQLGVMYGISDIEAAGAQAGSRQDSNPALIQMRDMWMARHTIMLKNWSEEFFMDVANRTVETAQNIAKTSGSYPIVATSRGRAWAMDWADFGELDREHYRLTLAPESSLPLTPAARRQMLLDYAAEGLIPREQAQQLVMGGSDIDSATAQFTAFENNADWLCEQLSDNIMPELSDLQKADLALQRVRTAGLLAHEYGAPDEVLLKFELFAAMLADKVAAQQAAQQAAMMPPPGVQNGSPSPPSTAPALPPGIPGAV